MLRLWESTMHLTSAIAFVLATALSAMPVHSQTRVDLVISNAGNQDATAPLSAAEERVLKPSDSFKECAQCPEAP